MINLARVVVDPKFSIPMDVTRRQQSVNDYGETETTTTTERIKGTLTVATSRDMERIPEGTQMSGAMKISTTATLYDAQGDRQADIVTARGYEYTVASVIDYSQYGFVQAVCTTRGVSRER